MIAILLTHALNTITSLSERLDALEAENADLRATLADPRMAAALEQIRNTEDSAVDFIDNSLHRADIIARLTELSGGRPRPYDGEIDRILFRLGLDCGGPDTIAANPSAARVLARLTQEPRQ